MKYIFLIIISMFIPLELLASGPMSRPGGCPEGISNCPPIEDSKSIIGEILTVEGDLYILKERSGQKISLHVDDFTQKSGNLKEGDQIEAEVTDDGYALKLEKAKDMK